MYRRRNVSAQQFVFEHPNEFLLYSKAARDFGEPYLICPHCGHKASKLFTLAHGGPQGVQEADYKFMKGDPNEVMCSFDIATLLADNDVVFLGQRR